MKRLEKRWKCATAWWTTVLLLVAVWASAGCSGESTTSPPAGSTQPDILNAPIGNEIAGEVLFVSSHGYEVVDPLNVNAQLSVTRPDSQSESGVTVVRQWIIFDGQIIGSSPSPDEEHEARVVDEWVRLLWFRSETQLQYKVGAELAFVFEVAHSAGGRALVRSPTMTLIDPGQN